MAMTDEEIKALALQAVCTPSVDAVAALDVLIDVLLEQGRIREPWKPSKGWTDRYQKRQAWRAWSYMRQQAWEIAKSMTRDNRKTAAILRAIEMSRQQSYQNPVVVSPQTYAEMQRLLGPGRT